MNVDRQALIVAAFGAPGSGKSFFLKQLLAKLKPRRLIAIDPDGEYEGQGPLVDRLSEVQRAVAAPAFKIRFRTSHERSKAEQQFAFLCTLARWLADPAPGQARPAKVGPLVFLVDELADFVGSSFKESPDAWQWILRRGRKYGVSTLAASQRPAQIDKTLFDLATLVRTGRLNNGSSHAVLADALGVKAGDVAALVEHQWIALDKNTGKLARG